jgi:hypothetical protein
MAESTAKTMKTKTTMTSAPAAGLASRRWVNETLRSRAGAGPALAVVVAIAASG